MIFLKPLITLLLLNYSIVTFSQSTNDTLTKKGALSVKGFIFDNGKPIKNVEIHIVGIPSLKDQQKIYSKINGSYETMTSINNFYKRGYYGWISFGKLGYHSKRLGAYLELPKDEKKSVYTLEAIIELVPKNKPDSLRCGNIIWSKEKSCYVISWYACSEADQVPAKQTLNPKIGEKATLKNIFFETDKSMLLTSSFVELNILKDYLIKEKGTIIEISGHTDNTGTEQKNEALSTSRAKAVADYLVSKGISASRIKYKGYGASMPVATNDTEAGRQKNRRVDFVIKGI